MQVKNINWITTRRGENLTRLTETKMLWFVLTCSSFALIQFSKVLNFVTKAFKLKNRSFLYENIWGFSFFGITVLNSKWYCLQKYFESYNAPFWQRIMYYIHYFFVLLFFFSHLPNSFKPMLPHRTCLQCRSEKASSTPFYRKNGKSLSILWLKGQNQSLCLFIHSWVHSSQNRRNLFALKMHKLHQLLQCWK